MKKLVLISTLIATFAGLSAFGQGYFVFTTAKSQAYLNGAVGGTGVDLAFLWGSASDTPEVNGILSSVPTSASTGNSAWQASTAWSDILTDPNFTLALNNTSGLVAVAASPVNGAASYNAGGAFGVQGTQPTTAYHLFMIAWSSAYATPALAAAANAAVGWSSVFTYNSYALTSTPTGMTASTPAFGVGGIVPEPTTMALAGLGGLALLAFRRRS